MPSPITMLAWKVAGTILVLAALAVGCTVAARIVAYRYGRNAPQRRAIYTAVGMTSLVSAGCVAWLLLRVLGP
jgi:hypothetical protein